MNIGEAARLFSRDRIEFFRRRDRSHEESRFREISAELLEKMASTVYYLEVDESKGEDFHKFRGALRRYFGLLDADEGFRRIEMGDPVAYGQYAFPRSLDTSPVDYVDGVSVLL